MKEIILKRALALFSVKSVVTLTLTMVFAHLAAKGAIGQDFMVIYTTVIAFYFGTQNAQAQAEKEKNREEQTQEAR